MAFPNDLLQLAKDTANLPGNQASFRRAVSTAYYALFHLLISEATANWAHPELRAILGRCFDHGSMRTASEAKFAQMTAVLNDGPDHDPAMHLQTVARAFIQAQYRRNEADYNLVKEWTLVDVGFQIRDVDDAFDAWSRIRDEAIAQAYLVPLLKDRRQNEPKFQEPNSGRQAKRPRPNTPPS